MPAFAFDPSRPLARPAPRLAPRLERGGWGHAQLRRLQLALSEGLRMHESYTLAVCADALLEGPELLDGLRRSGCEELLVECETLGPAGSPRAEALAELVDAIHARGMAIHASFTLGLDHDDPGCFERLVEWLEVQRVASVELRLWTPEPGCAAMRSLARADRVRHRNFSHWDGAHVVIVPAQMDAQTLYRGWCWARRHLASLPSIWRRRPRAWAGLPAYLLRALTPGRGGQDRRRRALPQLIVGAGASGAGHCPARTVA